MVAKLIGLFFATWLLAWPASAIAGWPASGRSQSYQGPCDVVTCAEAWSMTRAMTKNYNGPLFQLFNGTTTLDIGQINHVVDMSTWSAFCGGVQSNCKVGKIYAHIQTPPNNILVPSTVAGAVGGVCTGGGNYFCAAPFTIEAATGLPILTTLGSGGTNGTTLIPPSSMYYNGNGVYGADDSLMVGVTGGTASMSVVMSTKPTLFPNCCLSFGPSHKYNICCTGGTEFGIGVGFGVFNGQYGCANNYNTFCLGISEENSYPPCTNAPLAGNGADMGHDFQNSIIGATYDSGSTFVSGYVNGVLLTNHASNCPQNVPVYNHLGAGGDLSVSPTFFREGFVTNTAMSAANHLAAYKNMAAFYSPVVPQLSSNFRNFTGNSTGGSGSSIAVTMPGLTGWAGNPSNPTNGPSANWTPTLSGSMLIVSITWCQTVACTVTGSVHVSSVTSSNVGETCSQVSNAASLAAAASSDIWYCPNIKGGSDTITVNTTGGSPGFLSALVSEWTRLQGPDGTLASIGTTAGATLTLTTNGNVTRPGEIVYSVMGRGGTGLTSSSSQLPVNIGNGGTVGPSDVYQVTTTPGITYSNTMNWTGGGLVANGSLAVFH